METLAFNSILTPANSSNVKKPSSPKLSLQQVRFLSSTNRNLRKYLKMSQSSQSPVLKKAKVIIANKYGEKLVGVLHDTESTEIVILCHGFRSTKDYTIMVNLAVALENEGISAFRFDFAGNGESEGSFSYANFWREVDDLHAVIQHFQGANHVISAILGHSKGGRVVLLYASKYHDVRLVVNVSGRYDMKRGIGERFGKDFMERIKHNGFIEVKNSAGTIEYRLTEESLMDCLNTNMHEACLKINRECRVLTVHGSSDQIVPVVDAIEFDKIIPNHKLHIVDGADHGYTKHQAELAQAFLDFIMATGQQVGVALTQVPD